MTNLRKDAARALACLDLTDLSQDCCAQDINELCKKAQTRYGPTAAVCVWPDFVLQAANALKESSIKVATVVNFPEGDHPASEVIEMTQKVRENGADEIDMVIPWKALLEGHPENVAARVARVKRAADGAPIKAIIETGMLESTELIREATRGAIDGGADFVKTSTGKVPINATPAAAKVILKEIKSLEENVGFKVAGGVKTTEDASEYLAIADQIMGPDWVSPKTFRFGASGVLNALIATLSDATPPSETGSDY